MSIKFNTTNFLLDKKLEQAKIRYVQAVEIKLQQESGKAEKWMKERRPWKDRTGDAKRELYSTVVKEGNKFEFILGHGVPYGTNLEYNYGGRYEILTPTLRMYKGIVQKELTELALATFKALKL